MKQSDIFTIILVSAIGIIVSAFMVNILLGNVEDKSMTIKNIEVIEADVPMPEADVFNADAINPTVEVYVGDCLDADGNGVLDTAELIACGRMENTEKTVEEEEEEESSSSSSSSRNTSDLEEEE